MDIKITMRGGAVRLFQQENRPGGSYTNKLTFEGSFVVGTPTA